MVLIDLLKCIGFIIWCVNKDLILFFFIICVFVFLIIGILEIEKWILFKILFNFWFVGFNKVVWKGFEIFRGIKCFIFCCFNFFIVVFIVIDFFFIIICFGVL